MNREELLKEINKLKIENMNLLSVNNELLSSINVNEKNNGEIVNLKIRIRDLEAENLSLKESHIRKETELKNQMRGEKSEMQKAQAFAEDVRNLVLSRIPKAITKLSEQLKQRKPKRNLDTPIGK